MTAKHVNGRVNTALNAWQNARAYRAAAEKLNGPNNAFIEILSAVRKFKALLRKLVLSRLRLKSHLAPILFILFRF